jgi:NADPH-dependent glutamate synthase beta subunit-like oxidoreductase
VRKVDALGFVRREDGTPLVGMRAPTLEASGCVFCLSCVEVCPTGTLQLKFEEPRVAGERAPRCVAGCPAGMDIPRYLRAIRRGDFAAADAVIREASPFPRVLGQVCFHPCEDHCLRGLLSQPVAICALKRAAIEHVDEDSRAPQPAPRPDTGKTVAIIGSGPAGLTAAWFLRLKGHGVTVFEAEAAAGGWMRDGIPNYRLSPTALEQDIRDILALGVDVRTGVAVGRDIHFETLRKDHDAVFVATGARKAKALPCTGADLLGVEQGLALLQHLATAGAEGSGVADQVVVVIGGGNVAIDVARSAQRLGAREVHLYCLEQRAAMPAYTWEVADAEREGVIVHPGWGPVRITGDGRVEQVEFNRCLSVFDESGRFAPQLDAATSHVQTADRVLVAIGQEPDADLLADLGGVTLTTSRYVEVRADSLRTSVDGVFAGGEVVSGPASVVAAVGHGRRAAATIDRYLGGDGDIHVKIADETLPDVAIAAPDGFAALERIPVPHSTSAAANWWDLAEGAYSPEAATREAERCLACDLRLRIQAVAAPRQAWLEFSEPTIAGVPEASGVYRLLDGNQEVYAVKGTANLRLALTEIAGTTKAKYFLFETDPMYSKRESELIQEYLQEHGRMPPGEGDDDLDDLF